MYRFLLAFLILFSLQAQTPAPTLDKPPQDVDDALRARIKQFYDFHVARKYRQAETLIANESKDDFYVLSKPELQGYKIGSIEYSDKFTKAKVVIIGSMPVLLPMAGGKIMDMPFASFWKIESPGKATEEPVKKGGKKKPAAKASAGVWYWYYNKDAARETPFGKVTTSAEKPGEGPTALPARPNVSVESLQSALKVDTTRVNLVAGKPKTIQVTNTLPGPASLSISCPNKPLAETGITAKFDRSDLKGNDTASLTFSVDPNIPPGVVPLQITVSPTNQILNLTVRITRE